MIKMRWGRRAEVGVTYLFSIFATAGGECTCQEGLTRTRRSVEQDTTRWSHVEALEYLGVQKRKESHLL